MSTEHPESSKMDRLSSLPPELLSTIFDLAHDPEHPQIEPLSRTLLPYFHQNLYRQIRISSPSSLSKLLNTLQSNSSLAQLIIKLDAQRIAAHTVDLVQSGELLRHLPRLQSLDTSNLPSLRQIFDSELAKELPSLRSLTYNSDIISHRDADILSSFPRLEKLTMNFLKFDKDEDSVDMSNLDRVKDLSLNHEAGLESEEPSPWTRSLANFVNRFPRITSLTLDSVATSDYQGFLPHLSGSVLSSVTSLLLWSDDNPIPCDHLLPRFNNLRILQLNAGTVSNTLVGHLCRIPSLETLLLGFGTHDAGPTARDLLSLVEGPTRIQHLEWLVLHSHMGSEGKRFDVGDSVGPLTGDLGEDWNIPDFESGWAEGWDVPEIERLSQAGEKNGVKVTGLTIEAVKVWHSAQLELANRLILRAYQTKSLDDYIAEKLTPGSNPRLPDLDLDKLDLDNLKLLKIDLPEEDWFQFTLE
ncbi:hypothetical protein JCM5350_003934 [Sporobolomyces pararoseus]